jgi:hypothetical protein
MKILLLLTIFFALSCGNSSDNNKISNQGGINQNETIKPDGSNIQGIYATVLVPLNKNIHMKAVGTAAVQRDGDTFSATVKMKSGQRSTNFKQAIYTGRRCPTIKDDLNKDAYVDIQEAMIAIGQVVIPLDSNIDSQQAGLNNYPNGDAVSGSYLYQITASFSRMFADLKNPDENPNDNMVKLGSDEGLTFPGRIVFLQGISQKVYLPATVASIDGQDVHQTVPVACGVLWKVESLPQELQ